MQWIDMKSFFDKNIKFSSRKSIRYKLIVAITLTAIIPLIVIVAINSINTFRDKHEEILVQNISNLDWSRKNLDYSIEHFGNVSFALDVKPEFKEDIIRWESDNIGQQFMAQNSLQDQLTSAYNRDNKIETIELYAAESKKGLIVNYSQTTFVSATSINPELFEVDEFHRNNYYINYDGDLCMIRKINRFKDRKTLALLLIRVNPTVLDNLFSSNITHDDDRLYLINDRDEIVSKYPEEIEDIDTLSLKPFTNIHEEAGYVISNNNYVFSTETQDNKLRIIKLVSTKNVVSSLVNQLSIGLILGIATLIGTSITAFLLSNIISKPVINLAEHMQAFKVDDLKRPQMSNSYDEIGYLENGFDAMVRRIDELINIEYQEKMETRNAQLSALQAQINPHFLHNTFQMIGGMALARDSMDIYSITIALNQLMRYSMEMDKKMVTIKEEIHNLENYLVIQKERFGDRFTFENHIPTEIMDYRISKLSLQPIVENAFKHGFENRAEKIKSKWHISLRGEIKDELIYLHVVDNGTGIDEIRLKELRNHLENKDNTLWEDSGHIGLKNVDNRLKLRFGNDAGIHVESQYGQGTDVVLCLGIEERKRNDDLSSNHN